MTEKGVAFLVGIDEYQDPHLPSFTDEKVPSQDVRAVLDILETKHSLYIPRQEFVLLQQPIAHQELDEKLEQLLSPNSQFEHVLIYFSGHGYQTLEGKTKKNKEAKGYLGTHDARIFLDSQDRPIGEQNGLSFERLGELIAEAKHLKSLVLWLDACHSGLAIENAVLQSALSSLPLDCSYSILAAAHRSEAAYSGVFASAIVEKLQQRDSGPITAQAIANYVVSKLEGQRPADRSSKDDLIVLMDYPQAARDSDALRIMGLPPYEGGTVDSDLNEIWNKLVDLLVGIDKTVLALACKLIVDNPLIEVPPSADLATLKEILLDGEGSKQRLLKFAHLLASCQRLGSDKQAKLRDWVETSEVTLGVTPPNPDYLPLTGDLQSYLEIAILAESSGRYRILAEFIRDYRGSFQSQSIDLVEYIERQQGKNCISPGQIKGIPCENFEQVADRIRGLIDILEKSEDFLRGTLLNQGKNYHLNLELFLGHQEFDRDLNEWQVRDDFDEPVCIFTRYNLSIRSLERASKINLLNTLKSRWDEWQQKLNSQQFRDEQVASACRLPPDAPQKMTFRELATALADNHNLGYSFNRALPKPKGERANLFRALLQGGVLFGFWLGDRAEDNLDEDNLDIESAIAGYLKVDYCKDTFNPLVEAVWNMRKNAHQADSIEGARKHIGYHLGFLCDNPYRRPHLPQENPLYAIGS